MARYGLDVDRGMAKMRDILDDEDVDHRQLEPPGDLAGDAPTASSV